MANNEKELARARTITEPAFINVLKNCCIHKIKSSNYEKLQFNTIGQTTPNFDKQGHMDIQALDKNKEMFYYDVKSIELKNWEPDYNYNYSIKSECWNYLNDCFESNNNTYARHYLVFELIENGVYLTDAFMVINTYYFLSMKNLLNITYNDKYCLIPCKNLRKLDECYIYETDI